MFLLSGWDGGREGIYLLYTVRNGKIVILLMDINYTMITSLAWLLLQGRLSSILFPTLSIIRRTEEPEILKEQQYCEEK